MEEVRRIEEFKKNKKIEKNMNRRIRNYEREV